MNNRDNSNKPPRAGFGTKAALSEEDRRVWQTVTADVRPLISPRASPLASPLASPVDYLSTDSFLVKPTASPVPSPLVKSIWRKQEQPEKKRPERPPLDHGLAPGVDRRNLKRLRKGLHAIEARLDLHGQTQDQARTSLVSFVQRCRDRGQRCVLVITGKGRHSVEMGEASEAGEAGVLRRNVPHWLNAAPLRSQVLAFDYAAPRHGGEGALYVLLKRKT